MDTKLKTHEVFKKGIAPHSIPLKPFDIVLIRTDTDKKIYEGSYMTSGAGMSAAGTHWLIDQGVKVMGTNAWAGTFP